MDVRVLKSGQQQSVAEVDHIGRRPDEVVELVTAHRDDALVGDRYRRRGPALRRQDLSVPKEGFCAHDCLLSCQNSRRAAIGAAIGIDVR